MATSLEVTVELLFPPQLVKTTTPPARRIALDAIANFSTNEYTMLLHSL
jgi:hypothetical protein